MVVSEAGAIAYRPPYGAVINAPLIIPTDGVLAVGTIDAALGRTTTEGSLASVTYDATDVVAGTGSEFTVQLDAATTQVISLWTPEQPFLAGPYSAVGNDSYGYGATTFFEVEDGPAAALDLSVVSAQLTAVPVSGRQVPCGTRLDLLSGRETAASVVTHYTPSPNVTLVLASSSEDTVLSQHFVRSYRADATHTPFAPLMFQNGQVSRVFAFAPEAEYCVGVETLSLASQQVTALEPVCVADDGTDWSELIPATSEDIDAQLLRCPEPPEGFEPRYCALREAQLMGDLPECDVFTDEELAAAADTPIVIDADPAAPDEEPSLEPSAEPDEGPSVEPEGTPDTQEPGASPLGSPDPGADSTEPEPSAAPDPRADGEPDFFVPRGPAEPESAQEDGTLIEPEDEGSFDVAEGESAQSPAARSTSGSDGGCAVHADSSPGPGLWVLAVAALSTLRRRRRDSHLG